MSVHFRNQSEAKKISRQGDFCFYLILAKNN